MSPLQRKPGTSPHFGNSAWVVTTLAIGLLNLSRGKDLKNDPERSLGPQAEHHGRAHTYSRSPTRLQLHEISRAKNLPATVEPWKSTTGAQSTSHPDIKDTVTVRESCSERTEFRVANPLNNRLAFFRAILRTSSPTPTTPKVCKMMAHNLKKSAQKAVVVGTSGVQVHLSITHGS